MALIQWQVEPEEAGERLDVYLAKKVEGLSRSAAVRAIVQGEVDVLPRKQLKIGMALRAGDQVLYRPSLPVSSEMKPEALPLTIVYEDQDLAVINKPAGLVTHPAPGHAAGTLVNALMYHLQDLSGVGGVARPGIVHRLDKETSGLLVVAKHDRAHQALTESIRVRTVNREYETFVWGYAADTQFDIDTLIGRDPHDRKRFAVVRLGGKRSLTHVNIVERLGEFSLLRIQLETGRTHQIRVHCHYVGMPVVGDRMYGKKSEAGQMLRMGLERPAYQLLHAKRLRFNHPISGKALEFTAPWPEVFEQFYQAIKTRANH